MKKIEREPEIYLTRHPTRPFPPASATVVVVQPLCKQKGFFENFKMKWSKSEDFSDFHTHNFGVNVFFPGVVPRPRRGALLGNRQRNG